MPAYRHSTVAPALAIWVCASAPVGKARGCRSSGQPRASRSALAGPLQQQGGVAMAHVDDGAVQRRSTRPATRPPSASPWRSRSLSSHSSGPSHSNWRCGSMLAVLGLHRQMHAAGVQHRLGKARIAGVATQVQHVDKRDLGQAAGAAVDQQVTGLAAQEAGQRTVQNGVKHGDVFLPDRRTRGCRRWPRHNGRRPAPRGPSGPCAAGRSARPPSQSSGPASG